MDSVGAHNYPVLGKRARLQNRIRALRVFGYRNNSLKIGSTKENLFTCSLAKVHGELLCTWITKSFSSVYNIVR